MKKIVLTFFSLVFLIAFSLAIFLSTKGYETDRFNILISNKIENSVNNLEVSLEKIKVKLNFKKFNIFLSTENPRIR